MYGLLKIILVITVIYGTFWFLNELMMAWAQFRTPAWDRKQEKKELIRKKKLMRFFPEISQRYNLAQIPYEIEFDLAYDAKDDILVIFVAKQYFFSKLVRQFQPEQIKAKTTTIYDGGPYGDIEFEIFLSAVLRTSGMIVDLARAGIMDDLSDIYYLGEGKVYYKREARR